MLNVKVAAEKEIVLTRVFDAPRTTVFKVMTDPALIPKWWGPHGSTTVVDKMEFRPGGQWRFVQSDRAGRSFGFRGVYHEITPPARLVYTFEWEGMPGHISTETVTFEEHDGKTTLVNHVAFTSTEDRDGMLNSGMEKGATESMDRLELLIREHQQR